MTKAKTENFSSFKYGDEQRMNEKKDNLDNIEPQIFYRDEYSQENTGNHRNMDFQLQLDNQPEYTANNNNILQKMEEERQRELDRLDLDYSSRYSNDGGEKPDIEVSFV